MLERAEKTDGRVACGLLRLDVPLDEPAEAAPVSIQVFRRGASPRRATAEGDLLGRPEILGVLIVLRQAVPEVPIPARGLDIVVADIPGIGIDR